MVIITALALGANHMMSVRTSTAASLQLQDAEFRVAEAALSAGERVVTASTSSSPLPACPQKNCPIWPSNSIDLSNADRQKWWETNALPYVAKPPLDPGLKGWFVVEEIAQQAESSTNTNHERLMVIYRVTAASSYSDQVNVILQSTYARFFDAGDDVPIDSDLGPRGSRQSWRQLR